MVKKENERRISARIKGNFKISLGKGDSQITVSTIDLSTSGIRFKSSKSIPLFREISLSLSLPIQGKSEKHFNFGAIVVRSEKSHYGEGYNVALTFIDMEDKDRKVLKKFIDQFIKKTK